MATGKGGRPKTAVSIYSGAPNKRPKQETLLALWMKSRGISQDKFARLVGCNGKMVDYWTTGRCLPGLLYAFMIEKVTEGGVGVESWIGLEIAKEQWHQMQRRAKSE